MDLDREQNPIRGSRRTRPFAFALGVVVVSGTSIVALTLIWGVLSGLRDGESIELMSIEKTVALADPDPLMLAPSRLAPAMIVPEISLPGPALIQREREIVKATQDSGPALGETLPTPNRITAAAPTFDGRPLRPVKTMRMLTTAYSPDAQSCGIHADGITASGYSVWTNGMKLAAADTSVLPFGTVITVPGYNGGRPVPVLDRGGVIKGHRLDLLYPTHEIALQWGAQRLDVTVWEYAD